ncbi:MAG: glycosyltransferase, partial [Desulfitobacteriaceae bacterium]|nr:glycosyltransferase [Desulfitobacteriaceae bacterium]
LRNVIFCDPISKQSIPKVLFLADCLIFSIPDFNIYRYGVSFNKSFDYLASGKPVVMAGNPRNNIIHDAHCGISVPPGDPHALAKAVLEIAQLSQEERGLLGKNGRRYVEQFHNIKLLAEHLESLLG